MPTFLKMFLASLLALVIFGLLGFLLLVGMASALTSKDETKVVKGSVLVLDLSEHFNERFQKNPLGVLSGSATNVPGLYDVVRLIKKAKDDKNVSGIYIIANNNANGYAASSELREALLDFKNTDKFIIAHGDVMSQSAYFVASAADKVYANPVGAFDWRGLNVDLAFVKGTLDKLNIEPQIFYAGKYKSATEPLRATKMTEENKEQTREWLGDLYHILLQKVSESRKIDTATLHQLANTGVIQQPQDAFQYKLVDGLKYDDELKTEIKELLKIGKEDKLNFVTVTKYADAGNFRQTGKDKIALIYAEGDIIDGKGNNDNIASDDYVNLIRKVRLDKSIRAIVFRINSGGGSALASENIWRELSLARKAKPVVVSFGDVAASGGYYIASAADSIFANSNTITGSIGVFGIVPNMQGFFNEKLGITFDGVKTATYADAGNVTRPLNEAEKKFIQNSVDRIYLQFKQRVAEGRKKDINYIDSIAQGRVWSGEDALRLGLVDKIGSTQAAIECAARMAKTDKYRLREYPEKKSWIDELLGKTTAEPAASLKAELGEDNYQIFQQMKKLKEICGSVQTRLPFTFFIN
ncbi:MAG: signal peptide peptidase SppA [Flavisolibacter sp.]|jgi:protease-4|nr:signal peptide peptidase SppA [Flavisolibacter sp.]